MLRPTKYIILALCYCISLCLRAQNKQPADTSATQPKKVTLVFLEHCDRLSFDKQRLPDAQVLQGNVRFRHDDALLYCDSAYFYEKANSLDAFGNVRIVQADSLFGYGDFLYYDGNKKMARFRRNVRLEDGKMTLYTDSLNYDRMADIAYYYTGGTLRDSVNTLTSIWGQYVPPTNTATFRHEVRLENPNFLLLSDTLRYNTETNVADIVGPTEMFYQEETTIRSTKGWYDTQTDRSMLLDRSVIVHKDGKSLTGDTVYYNRQRGYGEVFRNMELTDSAQHVTLCGDYGYYNETTEAGMATDSATLLEWSSTDTLYMHADSVFLSTDTTGHIIRAYHTVRVFRTDMQAVCDSLIYIEADSMATLYRWPIIWSDDQQVSADLIHVYMNDSTVDHAHLVDAAFVTRQVDSIRFDQLSGKEIYAYMRNGELYKVDVSGNAETIFYPTEDDGTLVGVNTTQSSYVNVFFNNRKIEKVLLTAASNGTMYPLEQLTREDALLGGYFWADLERPKNKWDIFSHPPRTPRPVKGGMSATSSEDDRGNKNRKRNKKDNNE